MRWLDKLKEGASKAAVKAQQTVDLTRLSAQIAARRKRIRGLYEQIGAVVHEACRRGDFAAAEAESARLSASIAAVEAEIASLERDMQLMSREKACRCGKSVPIDTRFCPACGQRFEIDPESIRKAVDVPASVHCIRCDARLQEDDARCWQCGSEQMALDGPEHEGGGKL